MPSCAGTFQTIAAPRRHSEDISSAWWEAGFAGHRAVSASIREFTAMTIACQRYLSQDEPRPIGEVSARWLVGSKGGNRIDPRSPVGREITGGGARSQHEQDSADIGRPIKRIDHDDH
jgi:hypothetical protein